MRDLAHRILDRALDGGASDAEVFSKLEQASSWSYSPSAGFVDSRRVDRGIALRSFRGSAMRFVAAPEGDPLWNGPLPAPAEPGPDAPPALPTAAERRESPPVEALESPGDRRVYLRTLEREIIRQSHGAVRLLSAELHDLRQDVRIVNGRGLDVEEKAAALELVIRLTGELDGRRISAIEIEGGTLLPDPTRTAGRAVDRIAYPLRGRELPEKRGEILLDPAVGSALLAGISDAFVAGRRPAGWPDAAALKDGRWGSPLLTVIDDGAFADGPQPRRHDGEGRAQRRRIVLREGALADLLTDAIHAGKSGLPATGNGLRLGHREPPRPAPTQCWIAPDVGVDAAELLSEIRSGYYLLSTAGRGEFHLAADRFSLPVNGVYLHRGRARHPIRPALLAGRITELLRSVKAVAEDLRFYPRGGWYGTPTMLLVGPRLS